MTKVAAAVAGLLAAATVAFAAPITAEQAVQAAGNWAKFRPAEHMNATLGLAVENVSSVAGDDGRALFHVVRLAGGGYVITSADDRIKPIIAFSEDDDLVREEGNPLWAMLNKDLPQRLSEVESATQVAAQAAVAQGGLAAAPTASAQSMDDAAKEWGDLLAAADEVVEPDRVENVKGISSVSDVRVPMLMSTRWNQSTDTSGTRCYNIYTPNYYVCGCVATAGAQLMKTHNYPASATARSYSCWVGGSATTKTMKGGSYDWAHMVDSPGASTTDASRQAIAKLCYDVGVVARMNWGPSGSGATPAVLATGFSQAFGYASSKVYMSSTITGAYLQRAIYANLDAGYPVLLGINNSNGNAGHEIVADGYGYSGSTIYTHLNLGWAGNSDAWYSLPNIGTSYSFSLINSIVYNVFPDKTGEFLTGRITDPSGNPISGVAMTAVNGSTTKSATSNARGIYAINVPGGKTWTVTASKSGYEGGSIQVSVASSVSTELAAVYSTSYSYYIGGTVGNSWGNDIVLRRAADKPDLMFSRCFLTASSSSDPTSADAATSFEAGQRIYASVEYKNGGGGATSAAFDVVHEVLNSSQSVIGSWTYNQQDPMAAGTRIGWASLNLSTIIGNLQLEPGSYTYRCRVNTRQAVDESDYSNNTVTYGFSVAAPAVILSSISVEGNASMMAGTTSRYTCRATMSDGNVRTVTPVWTITSGSSYASVDAAGNVIAVASSSAHTITLKASYSLNGVTRTATKVIAISASVSLQAALDNYDLTFTTGGDAPWYGQTEVSHDGTDAARSGVIGDNQSSWMETSVSGPGTLVFRYYVRSEARYDFFRFLHQGNEIHKMSGVTNGWNQYSITVPAGTHTFRWQYNKDVSISTDLDAVFVDEVRWTQTVLPSSMEITGLRTMDAGSSQSYSCRVTMSDGSAKIVTPVWSIVSGGDYASISASGRLTAAKSTLSRSVTIRADYAENGVTLMTTARISINPSAPLPDVPVIIRSGAGSASSADIAWNAVAYASSYKVKRDGTVIASKLTSLSYSDAVPDPGVDHSYVVIAVNDEGETESAPATAYRTVSISVDRQGLSFGENGGDEDVTARVNAAWTVASEADWLTVTKKSGVFTVTATANPNTEDRSGAVTITAGEGSNHPASVSIIVTQAAKQAEPDLAFDSEANGTDGCPFCLANGQTAQRSTLLNVNGSIYARFGWKNIGTADVGSEIVNSVRFVNPETGDIYGKEISEADGIAAGAVKRTVCSSDLWKNLAPGPYIAYAILNSNNGFEELDKLNNQHEIRFAVRDSVTLQVALNNRDLTFATANDEWFGTKGLGADGEHCAMTKHLGDGTSNTLSTTVTGAGTLSFAYRVSSEDGDVLTLTVDGNEKLRESGLGNWRTKTLHVDGDYGASHEIVWKYAKDASLSAGADCAFLDRVVWEPDHVKDPPTGVSAQDGGSSWIKVTWGPVEGAKAYSVARAESEDGPWDEIGGATKCEYYDYPDKGGKKYWYRVKAGFTTGETDWSDSDSGYWNATLTIDTGSNKTVPGIAGSTVLMIRSNGEWNSEVTAGGEWLKLSTTAGDGYGKVLFGYERNTTGAYRTAKIKIFTTGVGTVVTKTVTVTQLPPTDLGEVVPLDMAANCELRFALEGNADWIGQTRVNHDGAAALRSGEIVKGETSTISAVLPTGGHLSFWWGTSSMTNQDWLSFSVASQEVAKISGSGGGTQTSDYKKKIVTWQQFECEIPSGGAIVSWTFSRSYGNESGGEDAGFVDEIVWTPDVVVPDDDDPWLKKFDLQELLTRLGVGTLAEAMRLQSPGSVDSGGKFKPDGTPMLVADDYAAGTNPLESDSQFRATIDMVDGKPVIGWDPALTEPETDRRRYQFFGRLDLGEGEWEAIPDGHEEDYNFFRVSVEMK